MINGRILKKEKLTENYRDLRDKTKNLLNIVGSCLGLIAK
jgi:hypothetical protein